MQLNEEYPELLANYDTENLTQEDLLRLNKEIQKEITNTAILKRKTIALDLLDSEVKKKQAEIDRIQNKELREQRELELQDTKKNLLIRIDAVEKETRIKLGLLEEEKELNDDVVANAEENDKKRLKSAKKTSEKIIDHAEIEEKRLFDLRQQMLKDQNENDKENAAIRKKNADDEAARVKKQNDDQEKVEQERFDKIKEMEAKRLQDFKDTVQITADLLEALAKNFESKLDQQIANAQGRIDESESLVNRLEAQADLGNLDAEESIKAEKLRQAREKNDIESLEKKKRDLQILVTGLSLANAKIQSGDGNAINNAGSEMGSFISKLKGFYKGTDTTLGSDITGALPINDPKETHLVKMNKEERIIGVENSRKLKGMNQEQIVEGALMHKNNELVGRRAIVSVNRQTVFNDSRMVNALNNNTKTIAQAIKNIPEQGSAYDAAQGVWTDAIKRGKDIERNHKKWNF